MVNALEVRNLTKIYDDFVLDNINFTLPKGCIMGLIGENGAGKSTTIKLILDLIHADGGKVFVFDKENPPREVYEKIGVVMDESGFPENLTARNVGKILGKCYKTWDENKFHGYLEKFNISEKKKVKEYSKGMKTKLSIAAALSHGSKLLILDEATSGLDPVVRDEILDIFLEFIQDEEGSILISSHILSDLEKICDYITFIHKGKIIFSEVKDDLCDKYTVIKCTAEEYERVEKSCVIGARKSSFGVEALVSAGYKTGEFVSEKLSIEDIMLYFIRGEE